MESTRKIFLILEKLAVKGEATITELSNDLHFGPSLVHRLLAVLRDLGYVGQDANSKKYFATLKLFEIGSMVRGRLNVVKISHPLMENLSEKIRETSLLGFLDEFEAVYVDKVDAGNTLKIDLTIGLRVPAYCTALGKILLADLPLDLLEEYVRNRTFKSFTSSTITSPNKLIQHLTRVREQGFALDEGELEDSVRCIAAPVRDDNGKVIAAAGVAGPSMRLTPEKLASLVEPVMAMAADISWQLGFRERTTLK